MPAPRGVIAITIQLTRPRRRKAAPRLELAPLIDVVFILVIFFAVSSSLINHNQGVKLQLPVAESSIDQPKGLTVSLSKTGILYINGRKTPISDLKPSIQAGLAQDPKLQVIFEADNKTDYELVVNALDRIRLAGCYDIVLKAEKPK